MWTLEDCRLAGTKSEGARRAALAQAEDELARGRHDRWRRQAQPVPARAPAPVRRRARRDARLLPVLGMREYRGGGTFTVERPC